MRLSNRYVMPPDPTRSLEEIVSRLRSLGDLPEVEISTRDGRVVIVLSGDALFDAGQTHVKPTALPTLRRVAKSLATLEGRELLVAAHADDALLGGRHFPSSWELSAARAVEVTRALLDNGVSPRSIAAVAYGEFRPRGGALNRRVEIVI